MCYTPSSFGRVCNIFISAKQSCAVTVDKCFELGHVMKSHGLKGEVMVFLDVDDPSEYQNLASVFLKINQQLIPYPIKQIQVLDTKAIVKFEGVDTIEKAAALKGTALYLPLKHLPELDDNQFYFHEIVGFTIIDQQLGKLGIISNVYNLEHQDLIAMDYQNKEVLIPVTDDIVIHIDRQQLLVEVNLPDGLLDVYLED